MLDGANGVTSAPRHGFPDAGGAVALGLAAVVALVVARWAGPRARWGVVAAVIAACVPGALQVLVWRADAPANRSALTAHIVGTLGEIDQRVHWPTTPVHVAVEDDDVLFPLGRYAVPTRRSSAGPGVLELELRGAVLQAHCVERDARVVCGATP